MKLLKPMIILFSLIIFLNCQAQKYFKSTWKNIDNSESTQQEKVDFWYQKSDKVYYQISNNQDHLFIELKILDEAVQTKILRTGLTTWIDIAGKNKKHLGIKFPLPAIGRMDTSRFGDLSAEESALIFAEMKKTMIKDATRIELLGFDGKKSSRIIRSKNEDNISGSIQKNSDNELNYTLKIPLKMLGIDFLTHKSSLTINIESVETKNGGMQRSGQMTRSGGGRSMSGQSRSGGGSMSSQGRSGGGGNMGGQSRSGGQGRNPQMMGQRGQQMNKQMTPIKIKIKKIQLSKNE